MYFCPVSLTEEEEEEEEQEDTTVGDEGREGGGSLDLPAVVPFSSADEDSLVDKVAPEAPNHQQTVLARVRGQIIQYMSA